MNRPQEEGSYYIAIAILHALDRLAKPKQVSIFKEVRSVMVMVDLAPDVWDEALRKLEGELQTLISDE